MHAGKLPLAALCLLAALAGSVPVTHAQAQPAAQEPAVLDEGETSAPVVLDGVTLFHVAGIRIYPADVRARAIADRLGALASNPSFDPGSMKIQASAEATDIVANGRVVVRLFDTDARLEGIPRQYLAELALTHIRDAIIRYRADRRPSALAWTSIVEAAWALALGFALWVTHRLLGRLQRRIERRYGTRVRDVRIQSVNLLSVEQMWRIIAGLLRAAWAVGAIAVLLVYLRFALARFPWTRGLGLTLAGAVLQPLRILGSGLLQAVPNLIFLAVLVLITRMLLKLMRLLFDGLGEGRLVFSGFEADWAEPTYKLARVLMIALAAVVAYPYIPGSSSDAFKGVSLFIGVVFSLGSSSIISNALAGLSMPYRRAFREGDLVRIGEHMGSVEKIRTLVTHLRTLKNEEVIVPNSVILASQVLNYSSQAAAGGLILHTTVGIGYDTPWRQVEAMLLEAAARVPGLPASPAPFVLKQALADFCVTYEINVYISEPHRILELYSALHQHVLDVFNEYGVQIMTPAYMTDPAHPKVVPRADWYAAPAAPPAETKEALGSGL